MTVALQIKDVREREFRAEHNRRLFDAMAPHRSLTLDVDDVVTFIRTGREGDTGNAR